MMTSLRCQGERLVRLAVFTGMNPRALIPALTLAGLFLLAVGAGAAKWQQRDERELEHDGRTRTYVVRRPANASAQAKLPVIIALHGGGGNAANVERMSGLTPFAHAKGVMVVYPNGTSGGGSNMLTWNAGRCCAYAMRNNVDDVGFLSKMIDQLVKNEGADPKRIYVTGMSNGGMMTHRLAVEIGEKLAGAAPIAGALNSPLQAGSPVPIIMIHGTADEHVLLAGGQPKQTLAGPRIDRSMQDGIDFWRERNQASDDPTSKTEGRLTLTTYPGKNPVATAIIEGEGHTWPGGRAGSPRGDRPGQDVNANELMWAFFSGLTPR